MSRFLFPVPLPTQLGGGGSWCGSSQRAQPQAQAGGISLDPVGGYFSGGGPGLGRSRHRMTDGRREVRPDAPGERWEAGPF